MKPEHHATGCFVAFLGNISILKWGWNINKLFCCSALELFTCLTLRKYVTISFKMQQRIILSTCFYCMHTVYTVYFQHNLFVYFSLFRTVHLRIRVWDIGHYVLSQTKTRNSRRKWYSLFQLLRWKLNLLVWNTFRLTAS